MTATPPVSTGDERSLPIRGTLVRELWQDPRVRLGMILLALFGACAVFAPLLAPYGPHERLRDGAGELARLLPPSAEHPMGTTTYGRDILSQVIWGSRRTLGVGAAAAFMAVFIGTNVGLLAGYRGGKLDELLMRLTDAAYALPFLPFAIVLVGLSGRNDAVIIIAIAVLFWRTTARVVRSRVLSLKERTFVKAARIGGASRMRTLYVHIAPNVLSLTALYAILLTAEAVMAEASLSFLGFAPPDSLSWGTIMFDAFTSQRIRDAWWWPLFPGLALMLFVYSVSLFGRGLERAVNPKAVSGSVTVWNRDRSLRKGESGVDSSSVDPATDDDTLLEVTDLRVTYATEGDAPGVIGVDGVGFRVRRGEVIGIVGESGSGKTSLSRAILGLLPADTEVDGEIRFLGKDLLEVSGSELRKLRWEELAFVAQSAMNSLDPAYRIEDQIVEAIRAHRSLSRAEARRLARDSLVRVGISPERGRDFPHQFSGGMRQRVLIAMAIVLEPKLLIADEPTTGLDVIVQGEVLRTLMEIKRNSDTSIILVTHDLSVVAETCSRVLVMKDGVVVESGETAGLVADPVHPYTQRLLRAAEARSRALGRGSAAREGSV